MKTRATMCAWLGLILASAPIASAVQATFQVNMGVQTAMGLFDPANDFVFVSGSFNGWSTSAGQLTQSAGDTNIYEGTFDVGAEGTSPNYKFIKNRLVGGVQWENDGVGPGGAKNRSFLVPSTNSTLDVVYFNNITNTVVNYAPVTFQVNMSVQIAQGSFDPGSGTLLLAGGAINNWDVTIAPLALTQSLTDTNLWVGTFSVTNPVGGTVSYKYVMNGTWESINDRTFVMTNIAQTLPVVYFNNVTNVAMPIPLTFQVNMGVQEAYGNFNPANGDFVEARGSFLVSGGQWIGGWVLSNSPSAPLVYSGTYIDTNDAPGSVIQCQFVINGTTWESSGNRFYTITSTNEQILPAAFFNNVANLGLLTNEPIAAGQVALSWTAGTYVRLQSATNLAGGGWQDVAGTEGQSATNVTVGPGQTFFRLTGP